MSFRNLQKVTVRPASAIGVADVLGHASMIISPAALEVLEAKLGDVKRRGQKAGE
jgi:ribosomal protein L4